MLRSLRRNGFSIGRLKTRTSIAAVSCILCLLMARSALGTEIILVVTPDWAVLAADSLVTSNGVAPHRECKISRTRQLFWSDAGLDQDRDTGFDIRQFFENEVKPGRGTAEILDAVGSDSVGPLKRELPALKRNAPDFYARVMQNGFILSLFAVSVRGGKVEAYQKDLRVKGDRVVPEKAGTCRPAQQSSHVCLMTTKIPEVEAYAKVHPEIWSGSVVELVDQLMKTGQKAQPEYIGAPFNILAVKRTQAYWLRQDGCGSVRPQNTAPSTRLEPPTQNPQDRPKLDERR